MPPRPTERYDVPDDSSGRVRYVDQAAPPAIRLPPPDPIPVVAAQPLAPVPVARADEIGGWVAVSALAVVLLIVFILGLRLTS
jgi:hypothetical protein